MTQIPTWSSGPANPTNGRAAPGTIIGGRYSLRAAVGHGGMGTVWRASDTLLRRDVAVKEVVLPPGLAPSDRDAMYERTLREARAAAALQHPAVVQVYDVVTEDGRPWIVMELLDARSLADMVIEDGPLAPRAVAKIGIALLGALEVAHAIGVLHRDVKPANVLICADGRCVLTDFGVARMPTDVQLTTPGMVLGSPHFISPERAMGRDFGPPSDLFSLGVTLYTAVEGRPPFDKGDPIETMHSVVEDPPAPPVRSGPLTHVLMGLLEKDPARRFDVHASRAQLRELLAGPLASKAPANLMTDPYAVVQSQRGAWQPPAPPQQQPSGQIGGRAMIKAGESLTDRLAELRRAQQQAADGTAPAAAPDPDIPTGAHTTTPAAAQSAPAGPAARPETVVTGSLEIPTGAMPPVAEPDPTTAGKASGAAGAARPWDEPTGATPPPAPQSGWSPIAPGAPAGYGPAGTNSPGTYGPAGNTGPATYGPGGNTAPGNAAFGNAAPGGYGPGANAGSAPYGPGAYGPAGNTAPGGYGPGGHGPDGEHSPTTYGPGGAPADGRGGVRQLGGTLLGAVRAWPRKVQLAAAGGLAATLLLVIVLLVSGGESEQPPPPQAVPTTAAPAPDFETQNHTARGVSVSVPKGWRKTGAGVWIDFTDPNTEGRKVRILVEPASATTKPLSFLRVASDRLASNSKSCVEPYQEIALTDAEVDGRPSAELEYTCGAGTPSARHGVWRAVVHDGKVYSFYLTTPEEKFAESRPVFDEMVRTFQLTDAT